MRKVIATLALLLLSTVIMSGSVITNEKPTAIIAIQGLNNSLDKFYEIRYNNARNADSVVMRDIQKN